MNADMADGIIREIGQFLNTCECSHGKDSHDSTPPMMYAEWIVCVMAHLKETSEQQGHAAALAGLEDVCTCPDQEVEINYTAGEPSMDGQPISERHLVRFHDQKNLLCPTTKALEE